MQRGLLLLALPAAAAGGAVEVCRPPQPPLATATPSATLALTRGIAHQAPTSLRRNIWLSLRAFPPPQLTKANFKELVTDSGKNAFVKFLAPW